VPCDAIPVPWHAIPPPCHAMPSHCHAMPSHCHTTPSLGTAREQTEHRSTLCIYLVTAFMVMARFQSIIKSIPPSENIRSWLLYWQELLSCWHRKRTTRTHIYTSQIHTLPTVTALMAMRFESIISSIPPSENSAIGIPVEERKVWCIWAQRLWRRPAQQDDVTDGSPCRS